MLLVGDWSEGVEGKEVVDHFWHFPRQSDEHLQRPLAVPDVVDLATSYPPYVAEGPRQVAHGHVVEGEVPEVHHRWAESPVTVAVATTVAHPHVEAPVGQVEGGGQRLVVDHPGVGGVDQSVLQVDHPLAGNDGGVFGWVREGYPGGGRSGGCSGRGWG